MDDSWILNRLFLVIPEMSTDTFVIDQAIKLGLVTEGDFAAFAQVLKARDNAARKAGKYKRLLTKGTVTERILAMAPELMSVQTVNLLSKLKLVDSKTAHALRISLRAVGAVKAVAVSEETILLRAAKLLSPGASAEFVSLLRSIDNERIEAMRQAIMSRTGLTRLSGDDAILIRDKLIASVARAEQMRGVLRSGKVLANTFSEASRTAGVWNAILVGAKGVLSDGMLRAAIKTGTISAEHYDTIRSLEKLGLSVWSKSTKAFDYDSFWARGLMVSQGILSPELVSAARQLGIIDDAVAGYLYDAVRIVRTVSRNDLSKYVASQKFRVKPGESPIQTYSRVTRDTDKAMLKLLSEAAQRSSKAANELAQTGKFGSATRAAQQRMMADVTYGEMRKLSEGMGYTILFGEREAQIAALEAEEWLQRNVLGRMDSGDLRSLKYSARAGMDSFVARAENRINLSRRVYGNLNVWQRRIDKEVNIALLRGMSARELAKAVEHLILPTTRGGVSYAAMRLARTEINNAFHFTAIRYTREMPWVEGYQWHLSSSHPVADVCNKMAEDDHEGMGPGVYKKKNVPGKPHPHCFCFITSVTTSPGQFEKGLLAGKYDRYLETTRKGGPWDSEGVRETQSNGSQVWNSLWGSFAPQIRDVALLSAFRHGPDAIRRLSQSVG